MKATQEMGLFQQPARDIALDSITKLHDAADIYDIVYRLCVINKAQKGKATT
jgi:hypothetical protein